MLFLLIRKEKEEEIKQKNQRKQNKVRWTIGRKERNKGTTSKKVRKLTTTNDKTTNEMQTKIKVKIKIKINKVEEEN